MRIKTIPLFLLIVAATPAEAFFCFNFSFGGGSRGGPAFSQPPIPPAYWPPAYTQAYPGYYPAMPYGYTPPPALAPITIEAQPAPKK